ncbi:uncharacterized protein MELLADRAFT_68825 [Melampsora larici-populina 98AG31]|uniref:Uncharacterized protein n=1 Tax=Melampsora larici-populina (strain 98AG31 / pathotype 3-4-7) TaxID=747676 RepID=F4S8B1_MELLP|nr:uncharacterized protein MELLADRAFT_68825 [Melampsora larici-populina 98AG31]EGF99119.1 hypothetical protein MELLADRAFT_68825 [Melampsora larici-populina 98AG31]
MAPEHSQKNISKNKSLSVPSSNHLSQNLSVPSSSFTFSVDPRGSSSRRSLRPPSPARRDPGFVSTPSDSRRAPQAPTSPSNPLEDDESSQYQPSQTEEKDDEQDIDDGSKSDASVILVSGSSTVGKKRSRLTSKNEVKKKTTKSKAKKAKVRNNSSVLYELMDVPDLFWPSRPFVSPII